MSVTIPFTFVGGAGNKARASEVNSNFTAVASKFTEGPGGISDVDISTTAGIRAVKLSSLSPNRLTQAQFEDNAVDGRVLKDDPSGFPHANAAVNLADHIADAIITNAKLVAGTIAKDRLKLASVVIIVPVIAIHSFTAVDTTLLSTTAFPIALVFQEGTTQASLHPSLSLSLDTTTNKYWVVATNGNLIATPLAYSVQVHYLQLT